MDKGIYAIDAIVYLMHKILHPEKTLSNGLKVYHYLAKKGIVEALQLCLQAGVDINIRT